jgi:mitochondrial pyruvate carrier 2
LFIRFAWAVNPRNYILFSCHAFNMTAQLNQLRRAIDYKVKTCPDPAKEMKELGMKVAAGVSALGLALASAGPMRRAFGSPSVPAPIRNIMTHEAGPFTIFFWAPTSKWAFSYTNLVDLEKPLEKISIPQMSALTLTGILFTRFSFVISPVNYNLAIVNVAMGGSSAYHLMRKVKAEYLS